MRSSALSWKNQKEYVLKEQLACCKSVKGKLQGFVLDYLCREGIESIEDVSLIDLKDYRAYVDSLQAMSESKKKYYRTLLEQVTFTYRICRIGNNKILKEQLYATIINPAIRNKTYGFLALQGITDCCQIDYDLRSSYKKFLQESIASRKVQEYLKALDNLKLATIKAGNQRNFFGNIKLKYENKKIFLLYHPNYEIAMSFYYLREKEEVLFDFSLKAPIMLKYQIFKMLNYILDMKINRHDRRERFLLPLKLFYEYCKKSGVYDIEQINGQEVNQFRENLTAQFEGKADAYIQIVDNTRKFLFLNAKATNWKANIWYLDRFTFTEGRLNPAREIKRFNFGGIKNKTNCRCMKAYMKYQIGVSQKLSLQTIRCEYYDILNFLKYLDTSKISVLEVTAREIEVYFNLQEEKEKQPESFNRMLMSISKFYSYMILQGEILKMPICFAYYVKNIYAKHNNRVVSAENQFEILKNLKNLPIHLRLMYLNLWCIGLRVNEVCVIKGDAYYWDGKDAWLKIYQNKMKEEKCVPMPTVLYQVMKKYIAAHKIQGSEYVFKNKKGGAYSANTFCKQIKQGIQKAGIKDYDFRSHDFRHTVGTYLYLHGASIEVIRDYLGHKESDMTKQYIDYMPELIDKKNEEYFKSKDSLLVPFTKKGEKYGQEDFS